MSASKLAVIVGVAVLLLVMAQHFGLFRYMPSEQTADNRLRASAKGIFEKRQKEEVKEEVKKRNFEKAALKNHEAKVELAYNNLLIDGPLPCSRNYEEQDNGLGINLTGCPVGLRMFIPLPKSSKFHERTYSAKLYALGSSGQKV